MRGLGREPRQPRGRCRRLGAVPAATWVRDARRCLTEHAARRPAALDGEPPQRLYRPAMPPISVGGRGSRGGRLTQRARIVIVGCGFGGLFSARALRHTPADVLIIDHNNYHLFQPLLYQVACAALAPADIAQPIRTIFRRSAERARHARGRFRCRSCRARRDRRQQPPAVRLPDPGAGRGRQLFRSPGVERVCPGHEGGGGGDPDPLAPAALVRGRRDRGRRRRARRAPDVHHRRRRPHRRGARRRHQGAGGGRRGARLPRRRYAPGPGHPGRGGPARAAGAAPRLFGTRAGAAAGARRRGAPRRAGDPGVRRRRGARRRAPAQPQHHLDRGRTCRAPHRCTRHAARSRGPGARGARLLGPGSPAGLRDRRCRPSDR